MAPYTLKSFWARLIRDLMREQGMSQRALCEKSGVSRMSLRNLINASEVHIRVSTLEQVLFVLGYDLEVVPIFGAK